MVILQLFGRSDSQFPPAAFYVQCFSYCKQQLGWRPGIFGLIPSLHSIVHVKIQDFTIAAQNTEWSHVNKKLKFRSEDWEYSNVCIDKYLASPYTTLFIVPASEKWP